MEFRQLRYFLAVAEAGHMTRAAASLGIQQPPLSQQIKTLERQLGLALFHRHPKGVSLTDGGRLFLGEAQRMVQDMAAMEQRMARIARGQHGQLAVGFTSSAAAHAFVPAALREYRRSQPGIALVLSENNAAEITEAVTASRLHCGLLRVPVAQPEPLVFETLLQEPVRIALPSDHPLAVGAMGTGGKLAPPLSLTELRHESFILVRRPGAPGLYANLLALCREQGFEPHIAAEVDRMMTNLNLVAAGVGISVVPASMEGTQAHAISYRALEQGERLDAPLTLVYRRADCVGPTRSFVEMARRIAARMRPQHATRRSAELAP